MKHFFFLLFSLLLLSNLLGCGNSNPEIPQERGLQLPRLFMSGDLSPLNLVGKLELFLLEGEKEILERKFDLTIQKTNEGIEFTSLKEGIRVDGLKEATYIYRISL